MIAHVMMLIIVDLIKPDLSSLNHHILPPSSHSHSLDLILAYLILKVLTTSPPWYHLQDVSKHASFFPPLSQTPATTDSRLVLVLAKYERRLEH
jgi:hypothetical protein